MKTVVLSLLILFILPACSLMFGDVLQATRPSITIASVTPDLTPQVISTPGHLPDGVYDALASTMGICFEAAWDASGRVFIMQSAEEHIEFYNLADNSNLCRQVVGREAFDFTTGDVLLGIWNRGTGCTAEHEIISFERDNSARTIVIQAQFSITGTCPYELVRGLWLGIEDARNYDIRLEIE